MKPEEKDLLLKDLSARLPYHVRCKVWLKDGTTEEGPLDLQHNYGDVLRDAFFYHEIKDIKPYLRSLSSMTEEEFEYLNKLGVENSLKCIEIDDPRELFSLATKFCVEQIGYLYEHHYDVNGLIPIDCAIEVTEENNPYKN